MKPNIAKILKSLRSSHQKTQRELAEFLGISRQAYSRYESDLREPDMATLSKIASYYEVSPQVFFIDDMDQLIDSEMDLVEMLARYQLKQLSEKNKKTDESKTGLDLYAHHQDLDQIQSKISDTFGFQTAVITRQSSILQKVVRYIFITLILAFAVNIGIMTLHRFDPNYDYNILKYSYINAILPDQNVNATMYLGIVRIEPLDPDTISVGDQVIIYEDFGLQEYFVQRVTEVDYTGETLTTTYDDATVISNSFDDIYGVYERDANLFGSIYYASKFNTGYIFLILAHVILLAMYYTTFMDQRRR